jgi:hypothetical protein
MRKMNRAMTQTKLRTQKDYFYMVSANIVASGSDAEGGISDDDEQDDDLPGLCTHKKLQSEFDRVALNEEGWQEMLNRARLRGLRGLEDGDGEQTRAPRPRDKLWEIGCQVCSTYFLQACWAV